MNKKEALSLIKSEFDKETPESEIIEILMSQDKISNRKPTIEYVEQLVNEAKLEKSDADIAPDKTKRIKQNAGCNYEKWKVDVTRNDKGEIIKIEQNKKLKDVRIDAEIAERMNEALLTSDKGYAIYLYQKS